MLSSLWSARWYLLLGLFSLALFLVITAPLHFVWPYLQPQLGRMPVAIQQVSGTLWDGQLRAKERQLGELEVEWSISPVSLFLLAPQAELKVTNEQIRLEADVQASLDQSLQLTSGNGYINADVLAPALKRDRITASGELELSGLNARWLTSERRFVELDGRLVFSGGPASFPMGRKITSVDVPLLVGNLGMTDSKAVLTIQDEGQTELAEGFLQPDGWGGVAVRRRFIDALGQTWPQKADEDTIIFEVSRKIL